MLEPGVEFEGKITVPFRLIRINTHVKGVADCAYAGVIVDQGEVEGEIRSSFITASIVMDLGGYSGGQCHMSIPDLDHRRAQKGNLEIEDPGRLGKRRTE
jgi:hypothetical protein